MTVVTRSMRHSNEAMLRTPDPPSRHSLVPERVAPSETSSPPPADGCPVPPGPPAKPIGARFVFVADPSWRTQNLSAPRTAAAKATSVGNVQFGSTAEDGGGVAPNPAWPRRRSIQTVASPSRRAGSWS